MLYIYKYDSMLGEIALTSEGEALTGLWFDGEKHLAGMPREQYEVRKLPVFEETVKWLDIYFQGHKPDFTPPLLLAGTSFRKAVWEILLTIPYGETMTYGEIADKIAKQRGIPRMAAQAVGGAVGHNPIAIIVPCHRVMGADGSLTGYGGGLDKKTKLLALEKII